MGCVVGHWLICWTPDQAICLSPGCVVNMSKGGVTVLCCRKCGQAISLQCHPSPRHIHVDMCQLSNCLGQPYNELDAGGLVALPLVTFSTDIRDKNIHVPL